MQNSRLIKVISHFSKGDIRAFRKFLDSSFFNQREDVKVLFDVIIEILTSKKPVYDSELIYSAIYPQEQYNSQQMRLVMSYLLQLIERYLYYSELEHQSQKNKVLVAKAYSRRDLLEQSQRVLRDGIKQKEKQPLRNADWHQELFQLQLEQLQFGVINSPIDTLNRQQLSNTLDIGYLISKLRLVSTMLSHQAIYKTTYDIHFIDLLIPYLKDHPYLEEPAVATYYHTYFIFKEKEQEFHFNELKKLLLSKGHVFIKREIRDLYLMAINHCIKQKNKTGNDKYFGEALELYKKGLEEEYLLENGKLSRFAYYNIVKSGIKTEDYDWVEFFINKYKNNLERKFRESSYSFSLSQLEYSRKNYDAALGLLQKANYRDLLLNLASKTILLKIYFEIKEYDLLESHLEAFKNFIRRKRVIGYHQTNYLNNIRFTGKLLSFNRYDSDEKQALRQMIESTDPLTEKEWLLAQLT